MLIDSHVHVGQFNHLYFSPKDVSKLMREVGVDYYAVSSTSMCEENYIKVIDELHELLDLDGLKVIPIMWITPEGLKGNIAWFLESDIKWQCIKVHPYLHAKDWDPLGDQFSEVIDIARELAIPVLVHTGNEECCQCGKYRLLIEQNQDIDFILAHGRPIEQTIPILGKYNNVYADSAFMPVDNIFELIKEGLSHKLLWGTDMCIPKYFYPNENMHVLYRRRLDSLQRFCKPNEYTQIILGNAKKLFRLKM